MNIHNEFVVPAPRDRVWEFLIDLEKVAPCMPGATLIGESPDGGHKGRFKIKIGPVTAAFEGDVEVVETDADAGKIVLRGSGSDPGGAGTAEATITGQLSETEEGTRVSLDTDLVVGGKIAQFSGRGSLTQGIADRMIGQFADRLQARVTRGDAAGEATVGVPATESGSAPEDENEPLDAGSLMRDLVFERIGGPQTAIALVVGLLVGVLVGRMTRRSSQQSKIIYEAPRPQ